MFEIVGAQRRAAFRAAFCALGLCGAAFAQIIVPPHPPEPIPIPRPRPFPRPVPEQQAACLVERRVDSSLRAGSAAFSVELVFYNPNPAPYEGTFLFPVPGDAAVHQLSLWMDGKEVQAELLDADQARKLYEDTVRRMRDPALLEIAGDRLIRARIFPIPPKGDMKVRLSYSHPVAPEDGLYTVRFPLRTPGQSEPLRKQTLVMDIESPVAIKSVVSPSHKIDVATRDERRAKVSFEEEKVRPERDFLLYVSVGDQAVGLHLVTYREAGKDGFFMAMVGPGYELTRAARVGRKAVAFVIDTSGSMSTDNKIEQVRKALAHCLKNLNAEDRFNVIDFSTTARTFRPALVPADRENVEEAVRYVEKLEARGGTAIEQALQVAVEMGKDVDVPYIVLFLTDGKPTIGADDPAALLKVVQGAGLKSLRLFTFGVGYEVNTHLLDRLAEENHGAATYVTPQESIDQRVTALHAKISHPALTDVQLEVRGIRTDDVYPQRLPDLFVGSHLTVVGRYQGSGDRAIILSGSVEGEKKEFTFEGTFKESDPSADWLPRLWATRKIGFLLDEMRLRGEKQELRDEVVRLSKEYGIITPYTSFLVLEDIKGRPTPDPRPAAEFLRREGARMPAAPMSEARDGMAAESGAGAVGAARSLERMRGAETPRAADEQMVGGEVQRGIRQADGKTYYLVDGRWTVSTYDGRAETVKVEYLSDTYFRLAREHPALARAFALGERVLTEYRGRFYEVIAD